MFRTALVLVGVLAPIGMAWAQTRICTYTSEEWASDLDAIEAALAAQDVKEAGILFEVQGREIECLSDPIPPWEVLRFAQLRAYTAFHSQDSEGALRWARLAELIDPEAPYPSFVDPEHPIRRMLDWEDETEIVRLDGQYVAPPKKGGVFVNGVFTTEATGPSEVPILVQVFDKKGNRLASYWQDGASFRPELLTTNAKVVAKARIPKWYETPVRPEWDAVASAEADEAAEEEPAAEAAEEPVAEEPVAEEPVAEAPAEAPPAAEPEAVAAVEPEGAQEAPAAEDAAAPPDCPSESLSTLASRALQAYGEGDAPGLETTHAQAVAAAACLDRKARRDEAAALYRIHALQALRSGDADAALVAMRRARTLEPAYSLPGKAAPEGDPLHTLFTDAEARVGVASVRLALPEGTVAWVDGAEATERPASGRALVQLLQEGEVRWSGFLQAADEPPAVGSLGKRPASPKSP